MNPDPDPVASPALILIAVILALVFVAGMAVGTYQTRIEATRAKCAVPCGLTQVEVLKTGPDWTRWICRCTPP